MRVYILLLCFFLVSLLLRFPHFNRPLSDHFDSLTAHTLVTISLWNAHGIDRYFYSPVMSYPHEGDRFLPISRGGVFDTAGNFYYVSYPPGSFYFAFFLGSWLTITPSVNYLLTLNLILHFVSCIAVYKIVSDFLDTSTENYSRLGLLSSIVYMFNPSTLWFQQNVYFADTVAQALFILAVYASLFVVHYPRNMIAPWICGAFVFLLTTTEWLGISFAIVLLGYSLRKFSQRKVLFFSVILGLLVSLLITVFVYSGIAGVYVLYDAWIDKILMRSGYAGSELSGRGFGITNLLTYLRIGAFYMQSYGYIFLVLLFFGLFCFKRIQIFLPVSFRFFAMISILPVILHHLFFLNFTAIHDFSVLKAALFISVLAVFALSSVSRYYIYFVFGCVICGIGIYLVLNPYSSASDRRYLLLGHTISAYAEDQDTVYLCLPHQDVQSFLNPVVAFYSQRTAMHCAFDTRRTPAVEFIIDHNLTVKEIRRL